MSQEQGLRATCESKVVYLSSRLLADSSVQSAQGQGGIQAVSQLLTESSGSILLYPSNAKVTLTSKVTGYRGSQTISAGLISLKWGNISFFHISCSFLCHAHTIHVSIPHGLIKHQMYHSSGATRLFSQEHNYLHKTLPCKQRTFSSLPQSTNVFMTRNTLLLTL